MGGGDDQRMGGGDDQTFYPKKLKSISIQNQNQTSKSIKAKINSEFNSIHFGKEINKHLKFLAPISFWV